MKPTPFYVISTVDQKWFYICIEDDGTAFFQDNIEYTFQWVSGEGAHRFLDSLRRGIRRVELERRDISNTLIPSEIPDLIVLEVNIQFLFTPCAADPHNAVPATLRNHG
jgi:hypothetical protein